jgi:hydrogenase maturation protease
LQAFCTFAQNKQINAMTEKPKDILIFGLGNDILMDDGIGPKLAREMEKRLNHPSVTMETAAIGGLEILEFIRDFNTVIIIDAIKTEGGVPGEVYLLSPDNFKETLHISSLHDVSFLTALELGKKLGIKIPDPIHIIAVEIIEDLTFGNDFTPPLQEKYEDIKNEVYEMVCELLGMQKSS